MARKLNQPAEDGRVRDVTLDGRGVAESDGKAVFIPFAVTGEAVRFRRIRRKRNFDEAELLEVLEPSPNRVSPPCCSFGVCGGCSLQHLNEDTQLELKHNSLVQALRRLGNLVPDELAAPLAGQALGYRRRARLGVKYVERKERVLVGFRERNKPYIVDMADCATLVPELAKLLPLLTELIARLDISRQVPQVELSRGDQSTAVVFRVLSPPELPDLERFRAFAIATDSLVWLQPGGPDSLQPLQAVDDDAMYYALESYALILRFGPLDFIQVNHEMNQRMVRQALDWLQPAAAEHVLDLFCGIGNFSLPLAQLARRVTGVELDARMVIKAEANAARNRLVNTRFIAADLAATNNDVPDWAHDNYAAVLLDPPRTGAREILPLIAASGAERILYVSCHPGTLARDAGLLVREHGYRLVRAGAMDMFPQTSHVEAMALFVREKC